MLAVGPLGPQYSLLFAWDELGSIYINACIIFFYLKQICSLGHRNKLWFCRASVVVILETGIDLATSKTDRGC